MNHFKTTRRCSDGWAIWDFPDVINALIWYRRKQSGSGIRIIIRIGLKVNQVAHVPTSVDPQHFIQIHAHIVASNSANRQTDKQTDKHRQKHVPPPLSEVNIISTTQTLTVITIWPALVNRDVMHYTNECIGDDTRSPRLLTPNCIRK